VPLVDPGHYRIDAIAWTDAGTLTVDARKRRDGEPRQRITRVDDVRVVWRIQ
jgi:hypothetical protein